MESVDFDTAVLAAVLRDDAISMQALLDAGVDLNVRGDGGFTPLHLAAQQGSSAVAELLVARGAMVDAEDDYGKTPLAVAVLNYRDRGDMPSFLLAHGADPYHANHSGKTPIGLARIIANYDVARFFSHLP